MQMKTKINVPSSLNATQRRELAIDIILYIQERSIEGRDKNEDKMPKYNKDYAELKGVGVDDVDLTDSGDLLSSITLLESTTGSITIGFPKDDVDLNGKAEGNIKGTYGQSSPIPGKKRDFLGIDAIILESFIDKVDDERPEITNEDIEATARQSARDIFGDIEFDDGE